MCAETLGYEDVRAAVKDHAVMERYEYLLLRRNLQGLENFVWCKNPECSSGQIHDITSPCPTVTCKECGAESCFVHDTPWHAGLTCSQYDAKERKNRGEGFRANKKYLSKHAKACPNPSCGRMIEKINGCDHMTCARPGGCGHEL
ncbi:IBR domain protein [Ceratobasidium sp. AG-Ba]|nr:IBR domain protein [Ceratobasidium sp. AG-Ba]QRW01427.1 IBR domain protein [Ceratobasidium sp. AG-Ba]